MTTLSRPAYSLAWRLALAAVLLQLGLTALGQAYTLTGLSPYAEQMRELYRQPEFLAPMLAGWAAAALIIGLTTWGAMRRWLARHDTASVDQPGRLFGTFLALLALFTICLTTGLGIAQNALVQAIFKHSSEFEGWPGLSRIEQILVLNLLIRVATILLEIIGVCLIVRIAAWTAAPAGPAGAPVHERRHAAWITGLTVLAWQLHVSIFLHGYLQMHGLNTSWLEYALAYWVLPAAVTALCTLVCLRILPRDLGRARLGRAVAHGSLAFWLAQALGAGLGVLVLRALTWDQLARAAESSFTAVVALLAYAGLLALGCLIGRRVLYRAGPALSAQA